MLDRKLLITGCGRSGTLYTSKLFQRAGLDVGHEKVGEFGCVSMYFITPTTNCTSVNRHQKELIHDGECRSQFRFQHVWHQVRHPLKTIDSLAGAFTHKVRLWTAKQLGVPLPGRSYMLQCSREDKIRWAMHYYIIGNQLAEAQASWTYRLEDLDWSEILRRLELPPTPKPSVPDDCNRGLRFAFKSKTQIERIKSKLYTLTWDLLDELAPKMCPRLKELSEHYGYPV